MAVIYSPDDINVYGARIREFEAFEGMGRSVGVKVRTL